MKVILQHNVQKLGKAGDIVETSDGYFRNFLQPRKLGVLATDGTLKKREEDLEVLKKKAEQAHQASVDTSEKINTLGMIRLMAKVGEGGKLYGKITNKEIAQELEKKLGMPIDKRMVKTAGDINALGSYKVSVKLASDVQSELTIEVQPEGYVAPEPKQLAVVSAGGADQAQSDDQVEAAESHE